MHRFLLLIRKMGPRSTVIFSSCMEKRGEEGTRSSETLDHCHMSSQDLLLVLLTQEGHHDTNKWTQPLTEQAFRCGLDLSLWLPPSLAERSSQISAYWRWCTTITITEEWGAKWMTDLSKNTVAAVAKREKHGQIFCALWHSSILHISLIWITPVPSDDGGGSCHTFSRF